MGSQTTEAPVRLRRGSPAFPQPLIDDTEPSMAKLDEAVTLLESNAEQWVALSLQDRMILLDELSQHLYALIDTWVEACIEGKGIRADSVRCGEEWGGPVSLLRTIRLMRDALHAARTFGRPKIPGPVRSREGGQLVARVFPSSIADRIILARMTGELWLEPGVERSALETEHQAAFRPPTEGKVALVLGAGNFSNLGPADILHKMFVDYRVVIYKSNPVLAYLDPILRQAFRSLIELGFLRIVGGGAAEGAYLAAHPSVAELHLTGSDKTYDAIVFGPGEAGRKRKAERRRLNPKRFTCELGNISPMIVVPGPWSDGDLTYQGEHIASTVTFNAGFNCLSTRLIVQHREWEQRHVRSWFTPSRFESRRWPTRWNGRWPTCAMEPWG